MRKNILFSKVLLILMICAFSACKPDQYQSGSSVLYVLDNDTYVLDLPSGEARKIAAGFIPEGFSPSGKMILLNGVNQIHIQPSDTSAQGVIVTLQDLDCPQIEETAWLNENMILIRASGGADSCLYVYSLSEGQIIRKEKDYPGFDILPTPGGEFWLQRTVNGLEGRDLSGTTVSYGILQFSYQPGVRYDLAFSPNGTQLAYIEENTLWKADFSFAGLDHSRQLLYQADNLLPDLRWSPDGRLLAFLEYAPDQNQTLITLLNAKNGKQENQWPWPGRGSQLLWGPDSRQILSYANTPFILDISSGEISYPFGEETGGVYLLYDWDR